MNERVGGPLAVKRTCLACCVISVLSSAVAVPADERLRVAPVVVDYDEGPRIVKITQPQYPRIALERGIEGRVMLEFMVDTSGRVVKAKVVESIPELDEAALTCVKNWRFKPAKKSGRAVAARVQAPVMFRRNTTTATQP